MSVILSKTRDSVKEIRAYYKDTLMEMAETDKRICIVDADLMSSAGMLPFREKYPERAFDCGVQESNMIGVSAGLSAVGLLPYGHTFSIFASRRACDQIFLSCAYAKQNVKIMASDPGITAGLNGGTHMAFEDIAIMRAIPEMTIMDPCDGVSFAEIIKMSGKTYGTWYIRFMRESMPSVYAEGSTFEYGKANMLADGADATIIASGFCVSQALDASEILKEQGINVRVLDMFTIKPIDKEAIIKAAKETGAIITAENHNVIGGLGSAVADVLCENDCYVPLEKVGVNDEFGVVGVVEYLKERFELTAPYIVEKVKKAIERKK